jgi:hypothetical protein
MVATHDAAPAPALDEPRVVRLDRTIDACRTILENVGGRREQYCMAERAVAALNNVSAPTVVRLAPPRTPFRAASPKSDAP